MTSFSTFLWSRKRLPNVEPNRDLTERVVTLPYVNCDHPISGCREGIDTAGRGKARCFQQSKKLRMYRVVVGFYPGTAAHKYLQTSTFLPVGLSACRFPVSHHRIICRIQLSHLGTVGCAVADVGMVELGEPET